MACTSRIEPADDPVAGACAEDPAPPAQARLDGELPWDLGRDLDSDRPPCPADAPDCDRLDEPDAVDDDGIADPDVDAIAVDPATGLRGLADPLTSTGHFHTWPNGRIPYRFAKDSAGNYLVNYTTRERVGQAMTNWETLTEGRIKFRPKLSTDTAYFVITEGSPRVGPFVGYRKDQVSTMYLRDSEYITVIKHELGHVVGFHHEQRRFDRSSYIQVRTGNIVDSDGCRYQFSVCSDCKKVGLYNKSSVMHYRTTDLSNCRTGPVLLNLDGSSISHYWQLNSRDLSAVATMYGTSATSPVDGLPESGSLVAGGQCVGIASHATDPGALLETTTCEALDDQDWRTTTDGQLRVQQTLQCAAVVGCSTPGALVEQTTCSPTAPDQKWRFAAVEIINGAAAKCLQATTTGPLAFADCTGAADQKFDYDPTTETIRAGDQCVTAADSAATGDPITLAACDGRASQQWFQGRGGFVTRANTARCLAVPSGALTGTTIALDDCNDSADQRWALRGAIRDARGDLCLAAGTPLALATCDGSAAQAWTFWSR